MTSATIEEVQSQLPLILQRLADEGEVTIVSEGKSVGRLLPPILPKGVPIYGRGRGTVIKWEEDDSHLEDFSEYMP